jgi:hypothetical protein
MGKVIFNPLTPVDTDSISSSKSGVAILGQSKFVVSTAEPLAVQFGLC